jgi:hypothetical protein
MLISCESRHSSQVILEQYSSEIRKITGSEIDPYQSELITYPAKRKLYQIPEEIRTSFFDFFTLDECGLQELIAEKNSAMGNVMPDSRLLFWEHLFMIRIKKCRDRLEEETNPDSAFINKLDSIIIKKEANLPLVYWNATFASPEFQKFFSLAGGPLPAKENRLEHRPIYESLNYLSELASSIGKDGIHLDITVLEEHLFEIQRKRMAGNWLQSIDQLIFYLEQTSEQLNQFRIEHKNSVTSQQRNHLKRIFSKNYRGDVQPYLSNMHQTGQLVLTEINGLFRQQMIDLPAPFIEYYEKQLSMDNPSGLWQRFQAAVRGHTAAWQGMIDQYQLKVFES